MNEVKFACPHCSQHIACDGDYAELSIECPSCGGVLVVPRLTAADTPHGGMVIVASTSLPPPHPIPNIPPLDPWTERRWAENAGVTSGEKPALTAAWAAILFGTLVMTSVLVGHGFSVGATITCLLLGSILAGFVRAKNSQRPSGQAFLCGLGFAVVLLVAVPALLLGILFVGCTACSQ